MVFIILLTSDSTNIRNRITFYSFALPFVIFSDLLKRNVWAIIDPMIRELITYLATPCPRYVSRMGYLYQAIALRGRYTRRRAAWHDHLENTQRFIIGTAEACMNRKKAVVLGSGLLLDVPLDRLSEMFGEVVLADIVHLPEVRRRIRHYGNVSLVQCDVTGIAEKLFLNMQKGLTDLPVGAPSFPGVEEDTGLVISLNILSQLAAIPLDYVMKKIAELDKEAVDRWCDQIREAHFAALKGLSCDVCLVADYEFARKDKEGNIIETGSTVGGLSLPETDASWNWEIAPLGEESKNMSKELHVGAWHMKGIAHSLLFN